MCYVDRKVPAPGGGAKPSKSALLSKLVIKTGMTVAVVPLAYAVCSALAALGICKSSLYHCCVRLNLCAHCPYYEQVTPKLRLDK